MRNVQTNLPHLCDDELLLFAERELSSRRMRQARQHLAQCPVCRARTVELEGVMADFASLHEDALQVDRRSDQARRSALKATLSEASTASSSAAFGTVHGLSLASRQLACAFIALLLVVSAGWALRNLGRHPTANEADQISAALPSRRLTPGATRVVAVADLCQARAADAPTTIDAAIEQQVFFEYGLPASSRKAYELDYLITPELGGSSDIRNLWPEPYYSTSWNAHVKDDLEDHLHELVCEGKLPLSTAQDEIASDWIAAYKKHFHTDSPLSNAAILDRAAQVGISGRQWGSVEDSPSL